jgi:TolB-like protein
MMSTRKAWIGMAGLVAALSLGGITGCENLTVGGATAEPEPTYEEAALYQFIRTNHQAADDLLAAMPTPASASNFSGGGGTSGTMLVATLADINKLEQSSALGRMISENLSSRLSQRGKSVVEIKLRGNVFVRNNQGEFLLTREIRDLARAHDAGAVVVGTYAEGERFAFVSLKVIEPTGGVILAAHDYTLPLDRQVRRLITKR